MHFIKACIVYSSTVLISFLFKSYGMRSAEVDNNPSPNHQKRTVAQAEEFGSLINLTESGRVAIPTVANNMVAQGSYLFIASLKGGMQIVDITNSSNPMIVSSYSTAYQVHEVTVSGNYAFLAEDEAGLRILDISNKNNPIAVGIYYTGWSVNHIEVVNNQAWLIGNNNLTVIDVGQPEIIVKSGIKTIDSPTALDVVGSLAYVTVGTSGFQIFNVSDSNNPVLMSTYDTPGIARNILLSGTYAFIADGPSGIQIFDVTNLTNPQWLSAYDTPGDCYSVAVVNNLIYVADDSSGLLILDITNMTNPSLLSSYRYSISPHARDVAIYNNIAYVGEKTYSLLIVFIDVSNSTNLFRVGTYIFGGASDISTSLLYTSGGGSLRIYDLSNQTNPLALASVSGDIRDITVSGTVVYAANGVNGLSVFEVSNPTNPILLQNYEVLGSANGVKISGTTAYIIDSFSDLLIIDITKPSPFLRKLNTIVKSTTLIKNDLVMLTPFGFLLFDTNIKRRDIIISTQGYAWNVILSGTNSFVADVDSGLHIFDISNFSNPKHLANYITAYYPYNTAILGNIAYIAEGRGDLELVNITNISNPTFLGNCSTPDYAYGVTIYENVLYVADDSLGLQIYDLSDPLKPLWKGGYDTPGESYKVFVEGKVAYVADDSYGGLQIINISNISNPTFLAHYDTVSYARAVVVRSGIAYVAAYKSGLQIVDASILTKPELLRTFDTPGLALELTLSGPIALVADDRYGVHIVDISEPSSATWLASYETLGGAQSIAISGTTIYIADGECGFVSTALWDAHRLLKTTPIKITAVDDFVYIIDEAKKILVFNLQNISNIVEISANYSLMNLPTDLTISGNFLYAAGSTGIEIVNITNPKSLQWDSKVFSNQNISTILTFDNKLYVSDVTANLIIYAIQGKPGIRQHQLTLNVGQRLNITTNELSAVSSNIGIDPGQIEFMISDLDHGQFELVSAPGIAINRFKQQTIYDGNIIFAHDGSEFAPMFQISLNDGIATSSEVNVTIIFNTVNMPPRLINNHLTINEGETLIITTNDLSATDTTTPSVLLKFFTNVVKNGRFEIINSPGVSITFFFQQNISDGQIQFVHIGGSVDKPGYEVIVNDGLLESPISTAIIDFNAAPKIITNQLTIQQGQTITLSKNELQAIDIDDDNASLIFIITDVQHGSFTQQNFSQQLLTNSQIQFTQDGSENKPEYLVSIADKRMRTKLSAAATSLSLSSPIDSTTIPIIAGSAAGGGILLLGGAIFAGFWYRRLASNKNSREKYQLARFIRRHLQLEGIDNFESAEGSRFVALVQKLEMALNNQGIRLNNMDISEKETLAQQIAASFKNKITSNKTWLSKSHIVLWEFENKMTDIVNGVMLLRAGGYIAEKSDNTAIEMKWMK